LIAWTLTARFTWAGCARCAVRSANCARAGPITTLSTLLNNTVA